ncbi:MAG: hypothetical protein V3T72_03395 [Thermoanaerobaculia bacterium]
MNQELEAALRSRLALLDRERFSRLVRHALHLYRLGYARISWSQMAAVDELIRRAASFDVASSSVTTWMNNALEKLEARRDRTGRIESWLEAPAEGEGEDLGKALAECISRQSYLESEPPRELDRLAALRLFWKRFYAFYRYRAKMGDEMLLDPPRTE